GLRRAPRGAGAVRRPLPARRRRGARQDRAGSAAGPGRGMRIQVLTIFPELFAPFLATSLVGRAIGKGLLSVEVRDLRDFAADRHGSVDGEPYGGGGGMVMMAPPWIRAVRELAAPAPAPDAAPAAPPPWRVLLSPQGARLDDAKVRQLAAR